MVMMIDEIAEIGSSFQIFFLFRNGLHKNTRNKHMILLNLPARYK